MSLIVHRYRLPGRLSFRGPKLRSALLVVSLLGWGALSPYSLTTTVAMETFSSLPSYEDSMRKRGSDGENARATSADMQKKARDDRRVGGHERATTSYGARREGERDSEEFNREAAETRERLFSWELPAANHEERQERQIPPAFDVEAAVKKLSQTKEYFAELCRNYLAHYKTQGADVSFPLPPACSTDSRHTYSAEETFEEQRNAAGATASFFSARGQEIPEERNSGRRTPSLSAARPSNGHQPPPECRRMPSDFDCFLTRDILQLEFDPSNATYREELLALESRVLQMLHSLHHRDEQVMESDPRGHECGKTILCNAGENKSDASDLSQFRSYQFAFKAAAVAEIVRLKSDLIKSKIEVAELLCDNTQGKGFSGVRGHSELVKRLKIEKESAAAELAQLRSEKIVRDDSFAEMQGVTQYLRTQIASCTCKHVFPGKRMGVTTTTTAPAYELKRPALDVMERQQDGQEIVSPSVKAMRGCHVSVSSEDEVRLEGICEASVEKEVFRMVVEKLDAVKADMAVFVKNLQSRVASVAGKINRNESRVRPVKVGLFCLKLLIDKLLAKKAEIEASLLENSLENAASMPDNRLGLKLHFRS